MSILGPVELVLYARGDMDAVCRQGLGGSKKPPASSSSWHSQGSQQEGWVQPCQVLGEEPRGCRQESRCLVQHRAPPTVFSPEPGGCQRPGVSAGQLGWGCSPCRQSMLAVPCRVLGRPVLPAGCIPA